jgi:hypothetical protein
MRPRQPNRRRILEELKLAQSSPFFQDQLREARSSKLISSRLHPCFLKGGGN